jgi:hypothetical protein
MKNEQVYGFDDGLMHGLEAVSTQDRQAAVELLLIQSGDDRVSSGGKLVRVHAPVPCDRLLDDF